MEGLLHDAADGEPFQQWPLTLAMIILGFLAGREPRFKVLWTCAGTLRTHIAAPALAGGLIGTIFAHAAQVGLVPLPETAMNVIDVSAMGVLSVSYTIWLLAILQRPVAAQWLGPLAAAGRMALSNYIIQCASFVALFSAYGVHARMNWAGGVVLGLLLWVLQVAFSAIWLGHFSMGPIEYVWPLATYGYRTRHE